MNSQLETLVDYLAGQTTPETGRLRDELTDAASEACLLLLAVRRRSRRIFAGPTYRWLGLPAQRGIPDIALPPCARSWRRILLLAFPWLVALASLTVAALPALPALDRADDAPPVLASASVSKGAPVDITSTAPATQPSSPDVPAPPPKLLTLQIDKEEARPTTLAQNPAPPVAQNPAPPVSLPGPPAYLPQPPGPKSIKLVALVRVPKVVGLPLRQAEELLRKDHLGVKVGTVEKGLVVRQTPPAGTEVAPGTVVEVFCAPVPKVRK